MTAHKIKQAALTLFTESGYEGASLSEIAKAVGIKTPSIYAHYESKEQLFLTLVEDVIAEEQGRFSALIERTKGEPPLTRLRGAFAFFTDLESSKGQAFLKRAVMVPPRHLRDRLRLDFASYERFLNTDLNGLFRECVPGEKLQEQEMRKLTALFYGLIDGLLVEQEVYEESLYRERQEMLWNWFLQALTALEG